MYRPEAVSLCRHPRHTPPGAWNNPDFIHGVLALVLGHQLGDDFTLKLKPAHTLDLVVLAAEWGSGRRKGWLSNLHLGARDPRSGDFVMIGKTFKGLTDKMLAWQTEALLQRETHRDDYTVFVQPHYVVEIAFNEVQRSPHYASGYALRFARVKQYRADKPANAADTIDLVAQFFRQRNEQNA